MSVQITPEHREIRRVIRDFVKKEVIPRAGEADEKEEFQDDVFRKLGELGFIGMPVAAEYGGGGADLLAVCIVAEELSYGCSGTALSWGAHDALCAHTIYRHGSEEQKRRHLPALCRGERIGCFGLTEPDAGSDAAAVRTTAVKDGDSWVLNGSKTFITNAPCADVAIIIAVTDKTRGTGGISAFIVEKGTPGIKAGPPLKKMGMRASPTSEIFLEDCRIPGDSLLGEEGKGFLYTLSTLDQERAFSAAMCVGIGRRAVDECVRYSRERVQFGQPIANFQQVQYMLAEMATQIYGAEAMMYDIIRRAESGERLTLHASMVKLYCAQALTRVTLDAIQLHGGYGYMREYPVERLHRDAKLFELGGGTNEIQRLVISRELLRKSGGEGGGTGTDLERRGGSNAERKAAKHNAAELEYAKKKAAEECTAIITRMPEGFVPERAAGLDVALRLDISGVGEWICRISDGACNVTEISGDEGDDYRRDERDGGEDERDGGEDERDGDEDECDGGEVSTIISTDAATWIGLSKGEIDPAGVFMSGALRVTGDLGSVMKVMSAFKPLK